MAGDRYLDPEFDDTALPEEPELAALAQAGEAAASALPASVVRRWGTRRRHRRYAAIGAGALALAVLAGSVAVGSTGALFTQEPPIVASPTPVATSPAPAPTPSTAGLTEANLLRVSDIPVQTDTQRVQIAPVTEQPARVSACVPAGGLEQLGASASLLRNFRYVIDDPTFTPDPANPSTGQPTYYTEALQFADPDAAAAAEQTYAGWLDDCRDVMTGKGLTLIGGGSRGVWTEVKIDRSATQTGTTVGRFASVPTFQEPGDTGEGGWFENVGLTQVDDRLMVTIRLTYGQDDNYSLQQDGDPTTGIPADPQFALVLAAAQRLGR